VDGDGKPQHAQLPGDTGGGSRVMGEPSHDGGRYSVLDSMLARPQNAMHMLCDGGDVLCWCATG
jgi:hypothetical protein